MVVQVFGSADKVAGPQASDALRDRLIRAFPSRVLWVFGREELVGFLEQSGYPPDEQLGKNDEATLAKFLRADEYIRGNVTRNGDVYRIDAQLVLTRNAGLTQPLPAVEDRRADRAAEGLVRAIQDARKQLDNEKRCLDFARDDKLDEAVAAADAGIREYPNATLVRYCKIQVLVRRKAPSAELLAAAEEILAIDPKSGVALSIAADAQKEAGNVDAANELLVRLLATDPTNAQLATDVVDALAASRKYDVAKEIVNQAVADNPGDIGLIRLQFLILASSGDFKPAIRTGEEMVQMDTSLADVAFFNRLAALYSADSQPQKAAEAAARGTQKFPNNGQLWLSHAQLLRQSGQLQQSIVSLRRAMEVDTTVTGGWVQIASVYNDLEMPDSVMAALAMAQARGESPDQIGQVALGVGNKLYRVAAAEEPKVVESFERALPYLTFADSTTTNVEMKSTAKFLIGVSNFYIAHSLSATLPQTKNCEQARKGEAASISAVTNIQAGARTSPDVAGQLLPVANQLLPFYQQSAAAYCK